MNASQPAGSDATNAPDTPYAIEMIKVSKAFDEHVVLREINLQLQVGENLVVMGKSGTGKSVLIKCIAGLLEIDSGEILIEGKEMAELQHAERTELRKKTGFLFQGGALYDSMTVRENLEFPLRRHLRQISSADLQAMIEEALSNVGLEIPIDTMPSELSGGMRKRLGLARTLILKPAIMLYDEPTTGLDPITSKEISKLILDVQKQFLTSSIIVTHDLDCARRTGNRIVLIHDGMCTAEGSYDDLENSQNEWIRSFFA